MTFRLLVLIFLWLVIGSGSAYSSEYKDTRTLNERIGSQANLDKEAHKRTLEFVRSSEAAFRKASLKKNVDKAAYLAALVDFARAHASEGKKAKADELFEEGLAFYKSNSSSIPFGYQNLFNYMDRSQSIENTENYFLTLIELAEAQKASDPGDIDNLISFRIQDLIFRGIKKESAYSLWEKSIAFRIKQRGDRDKTLMPLYGGYASCCSGFNDLKGAEKYLLKQIDLVNDDPSESSYYQLCLAQFYLRNNLFEKSRAAFLRALKTEPPFLSKRNIPLYNNLLEKFAEKSQLLYVEALALAVLERANDEVLRTINSALVSLNDAYLKSANFDKAESLIKKRLEASTKCMDDTFSSDWRLKLSDLYLVMKRDDESQKMFSQAQGSLALQGINTTSVVQARESLLSRLNRTPEANKGKVLASDRYERAQRPVIRFLLFANQELRIGGGTDIRSKDSSKFNPEIQKLTDSERYEKLGVAEICCLGNMLIEGPFSQDGKIYGKRSREGYSNILPLPQNLKSPCSALAIPAATKSLDSSKNEFPNIAAGDYVADAKLIAQKFNLKNTGRVRIFLEDTPPDATNYILNLRTNRFARATNLQIWYRGTKTIVVDEDTCAVIYAPDATVQISSGKEFTGAIVANRIFVEGNSRLRFDKSLLSEVFF